jgi:hypothetical protein
MSDEAGMRYGLAHAGLVLAALLAAACGLPRPASFVVLALTALLGGRGQTIGWRVAVAVAAWAIWTGFFEHTLGVLTFSGQDLLRLAALTTVAAACTVRATRSWARLAR